MAQPKQDMPLTASEVVGAKRGGPPHLIDGIGPGKGVITKPSLSGNILPEAVSTHPSGAEPAYKP
jgi:hypothetical protein